MAKGKTIAIIDDDLPSVEVLVKFLRKAGHRVHYFYDGVTGLDFIRRQVPDLVLSDMLLPKLHGLDLCRQLKKLPQCANIPVALMTGVYRDPRHREEVLGAGADVFFTKPFDLARTINTLQALMGEGDLEVAPESVKEEIETVARDYAQALPYKVAEIGLLLERLQTQKGSRDACAYLHLQIHSLAGSSATFGFNELSKWAAAASAYLRGLLDRKVTLGEAEFEQLETFMMEIRLNLPGQDMGERIPTAPRRPFVNPGPADNQRRLIYLVEPSLGLANELTLELELFGFLVRRFADEFELNEAREIPDAVVMAFEMPQGQLYKVRQHPLYRSVPVVFLSSDSGMAARLAAVRVGGDAFLLKPLDTGVLVALVHEITSAKRTTRTRVLLVDSDRERIDRHVSILNQADMVTRLVTDPLTILEPLHSFAPDLILIDLDLTGCTGVELVRLIHQDDAYLGIAIIFLTSEDNPLKREELLSERVDDVLLKPVKPGRLVSRITYRGRRFRNLRTHMLRDGLTGLLNQASVLNSLALELERARRQTGSLSVAVFDIDQLGRLNKMMGHEAGNVAIRGLAGMLTRRLRNSDIIGRYVGPAILVLFPDTDGARVDAVLKGIAADFSRVLQHVDEHEFYVTFSCGVADYPRYKDVGELLEGARAALRKAKTLGGNRVLLQT